jgi:hypothetical protein
MAQGHYRTADATVAAYKAVAVTPTDTATTTIEITRGLYVGGSGDVTVVMAEAATPTTTVTFSGVTAGTILPIQILRVAATGTTATLMLAMY